MLYEARRNAEQDQEEITWIERSILAADAHIAARVARSDVIAVIAPPTRDREDPSPPRTVHGSGRRFADREHARPRGCCLIAIVCGAWL